MIDEGLRATIEPELISGEKLLWVGKPQSFSLIVIAGMVIFLSIFILAFTVQLGKAIILGDPSNVEMTFNGVPIDANTSMDTIYLAFISSTGLILVVALFCIYFVKSRLSEVYAVTNYGALLKRQFFPKHVVRIREPAFDHIIRYEGPEIGTLAFNQKDEHPVGWIVSNFRFERIKFHNINNPLEVEKLILKQFPNTSSEDDHE